MSCEGNDDDDIEYIDVGRATCAELQTDVDE